MIRFLFILGVVITVIYTTWTMTIPPGLNNRVGSEQVDRSWDPANKVSKVAGNIQDKDPKRSTSLAESISDRSNPVTNQDDGSSLLALRRELARLGAEVDALRRDVETLAERDQLAATEEDFYADEEKPIEILEAEALAAQEESEWQVRRYMDSMEERFQREVNYTGWSTPAAELIEQALQSKLFSETSLISLECRSSLCRLEVRHDNPQASSAFSRTFPEKVAAMFSKFSIDYQDQGDGYSSSMVIYLMQEERS